MVKGNINLKLWINCYELLTIKCKWQCLYDLIYHFQLLRLIIIKKPISDANKQMTSIFYRDRGFDYVNLN